METVWVLGDQLNRWLGALGAASPERARLLFVESAAKIHSKPFHRQRLHLVLTAMRRFAEERRAEGFEVDYRLAPHLAAGLEAHLREFGPSRVVATEPLSRSSWVLLDGLGVELHRSNQFLCHHRDFAEWARGRRTLRLEDFYRRQRRRLGYLMDGDEPAGGRWNFDRANREPPPKGPPPWPPPPVDELDALDAEVSASLPPTAWGDPTTGLWATTRAGALRRLQHFVDEVLPGFGPHEDAMTTGSWHLAHSLLSPYLNLGLLLPGEVCDAVEAAYRAGAVPIESAEGFVRQVIGWREFVWGVYWLRPDMADSNVLGETGPLPPVFEGRAETAMRCVADVLDGVRRRGWAHHIQRLMVLANLATLAGVRPQAVLEWMWASFVDGAEWVMVPNVIGMGMWADGGGMSSKPYVSGGAYISRMSDYCGGCPFDPTCRTGDRACPFTTLYWDFLARHRPVLERNHRMALVLGSLGRLQDLDAVRERAAEMKKALGSGEL
jgi:deoxyribodipyrimidine photolyase-related protein